MKQTINEIKKDIKNAKLIAVTKTRTIEEMKKAKELGLLDFGENKVQEFQKKYDEFDNTIRWHFIGHLQRNKVKYIVGKVYLIHSVDSIRLAKEINKEAKKKNITQNVLLQFNVAKEESKYGFNVEDLNEILEEISRLKNLNVIGLMTMAPYLDNPENTREYFRQLKDLSVDINSQKIDNIHITELSMGMSNDYLVAVEEGSTMIRIGTAIFGKRDYVDS